jgi:opacity protein-like surface antigen
MNMFSFIDNALNVNNAGKGGSISQSDFSSEEDFMNYQRIVSNVSPEKQNTRMKHKQPVSVGLTVHKELSKHFALETGLIYTYLSSELSAGSDTDYYKQDQTLHYVGIPLKANVSLYKKERTDLYATAGGMIEKCVSGKIKNAYYEHGERFYTSSSSLQTDPLLFSLTLSAGIQYRLGDYFSVYAEPGIGYYFDDGSPIASVRKDKPFNFNLLCGVRMTY